MRISISGKLWGGELWNNAGDYGKQILSGAVNNLIDNTPEAFADVSGYSSAVELIDAAQTGDVQTMAMVAAMAVARPVKILDKAGDRAAGTHRQLNNAGASDSHHIIQHAAAKNLPGYNRMDAPAVQLKGPSTKRGSEHYNATQVQRQRGGGTYAAERRIGYKALRRAGISRNEARNHIQRADNYFVDGLGVKPDTVMRPVRNRL